VGRIADRIDRVGLEDVTVTVEVFADAGADLDDRRTLLAVGELELLAGRVDCHLLII
jgi:hypothetical protein